MTEHERELVQFALRRLKAAQGKIEAKPMPLAPVGGQEINAAIDDLEQLLEGDREDLFARARSALKEALRSAEARRGPMGSAWDLLEGARSAVCLLDEALGEEADRV